MLAGSSLVFHQTMVESRVGRGKEGVEILDCFSLNDSSSTF